MVRRLGAALIALAMLLAPLGLGSAMANPMAGHHSASAKTGHCDEAPAAGKAPAAADKDCCAAMCSAIAMSLPLPGAPLAFARSLEPPVQVEASHGFLARLPTPPPRAA